MPIQLEFISVETSSKAVSAVVTLWYVASSSSEQLALTNQVQCQSAIATKMQNLELESCEAVRQTLERLKFQFEALTWITGFD